MVSVPPVLLVLHVVDVVPPAGGVQRVAAAGHVRLQAEPGGQPAVAPAGGHAPRPLLAKPVQHARLLDEGHQHQRLRLYVYASLWQYTKCSVYILLGSKLAYKTPFTTASYITPFRIIKRNLTLKSVL